MKIESDEGHKQRMKSYLYMKKIEDEETWQSYNLLKNKVLI